MGASVKDDDWNGVAVKQGPDPERRLAELKAKAPATHKKTTPFAKARLNSAAHAFAALNCPKAMVWVWLVHRVWKRQCLTVSVPNGELAKLGVSRYVKLRALRQLEAAGLIVIDQRPRKTPLVTML